MSYHYCWIIIYTGISGKIAGRSFEAFRPKLIATFMGYKLKLSVFKYFYRLSVICAIDYCLILCNRDAAMRQYKLCAANCAVMIIRIAHT